MFSNEMKYTQGSDQRSCARSSAIAKLATDPTVMWVLRQYLRTPAVSCGHVPSILTAYPLDDERYPGPQGWHSVRALCDFFLAILLLRRALCAFF